MSPALIAALPFLGALLPGLLIRSGRNVAACACATASALALIGLCLHIPTVLAGGVVTANITWLPQIGLNASFRIDGLSLLFGILILGIGLLIILYARYYLAKADPVGQFYTYLMLFQGAMLGIVLSGLLYQIGGMTACLVGSAVMLAICWLVTVLLPASVRPSTIARETD